MRHVLTLAIGLWLTTAWGAERRPDPPMDLSVAGAGGCPKHVVVTGYWPPTNDMLRPWSTDPASNPDGWHGRNWRGHGFDVYAYFPEFPPDGVPFNDPRGSDGYIGSADSDFRVDYQDTSADFWRIVDAHRPLMLITTSRGGSIGWEVEAVEGGHGGSGDPSGDWSSDHRPPQTLPTRDSIDPRSWDAISTFRGGRQLPSQLPIEAIADAATALDLTSVAIDHGTSGNYLSGFMGLHGLYYEHITPATVAAGHIHVGIEVSPADARRLMEVTLETVLAQHDPDALGCSGTEPGE
jgi:hypothetical protein